jgi:hypothetical protein
MKVNSKYIENETDSTYISPEAEQLDRKRKFLPKINTSMRYIQKIKKITKTKK